MKLLARVADLVPCLLHRWSPHITDLQEGDGNRQSSVSLPHTLSGGALRTSWPDPHSDTTTESSSFLQDRRQGTVKICNYSTLVFVLSFRSLTYVNIWP